MIDNRRRNIIIKNFREVSQNLRLDDVRLRKSWYDIKVLEYSKNQPIKLSILEHWYTNFATPENHNKLYKNYVDICKKFGVAIVDDSIGLLYDLYTRFSEYAFNVQFKNYLKYDDGSLKLYNYGYGKLACKQDDGSFIDFYTGVFVYLPEQCMSLSGLAVSQFGIFIPVKSHILR